MTPKYVALTGKLANIEFRSGKSEYVTFSLKQGKHWTSCIASGLVVDALKLAVADAKAMVYGIEEEKKYFSKKDNAEKIGISVKVYAITLDAKAPIVDNGPAVYTDIPDPSIYEDSLPF